MNKEIWKDIEGYQGYQISNFGNIKSFRKYKNGKLMIPQKDKKGYLQICLYKNRKSKTKKMHRLVAQTFILNNENKPQVNHIDGNKTNNNVNNLEWCNNSENQLHAYKNGLEKPRFARKVIQKDIFDKTIRIWDTIREASFILKIDESSIGKCCRKERKTAGNYKWQYYGNN